ncbi:hypothetical protein VKT23_020385 [Stygiomarasmius scandens]|uniref:Uncharacterized protein n=1 Tax=Marasmiellus scandens TaxID=2682957 RepID=A0ABR1IKE7_9AGAR
MANTSDKRPRGRPRKYFSTEEKKAARKRFDAKYYQTKGKALRRRKREEAREKISRQAEIVVNALTPSDPPPEIQLPSRTSTQRAPHPPSSAFRFPPLPPSPLPSSPSPDESYAYRPPILRPVKLWN